MRATNVAVNLIKNFEGFSAKVYQCPGGFKTIGYGHKLIDTEFDAHNITQEYATELLLRDIHIVELSVIRNLNKTVELSWHQFDAIISFAYNVGTAAFQRSTLRQKINYGADDTEIAGEFLKWVYANGKKLPGLIFRRQVEYKLFLYAKYD